MKSLSTNNKGETMTKTKGTKEGTKEKTKTSDLNLDFNSMNPLEDDLYGSPEEPVLLTQRQYRFIKQFQRVFLKHREQRCTTLYEPRVGTTNGTTNRTTNSITNRTNNKTNRNKPSDPIADIADSTLPYISHLNKYGDCNIRVVESYFCSNLTIKKLKEKHTETKIEIKTITKTKKNGKQKTKEIEIVKEYFDETGLYDELYYVVNILDKIERMLKKEEWERMDEDERMIVMLRDVVERTSKLKVANDL
jgi:hypothetical protein